MSKKKLNIGLYLRKSSGLEDNINLINQKNVGVDFCKKINMILRFIVKL